MPQGLNFLTYDCSQIFYAFPCWCLHSGVRSKRLISLAMSGVFLFSYLQPQRPMERLNWPPSYLIYQPLTIEVKIYIYWSNSIRLLHYLSNSNLWAYYYEFLNNVTKSWNIDIWVWIKNGIIENLTLCQHNTKDSTTYNLE